MIEKYNEAKNVAVNIKDFVADLLPLYIPDNCDYYEKMLIIKEDEKKIRKISKYIIDTMFKENVKLEEKYNEAFESFFWEDVKMEMKNLII